MVLLTGTQAVRMIGLVGRILSAMSWNAADTTLSRIQCAVSSARLACSRPTRIQTLLHTTVQACGHARLDRCLLACCDSPLHGSWVRSDGCCQLGTIFYAVVLQKPPHESNCDGGKSEKMHNRKLCMKLSRIECSAVTWMPASVHSANTSA